MQRWYNRGMVLYTALYTALLALAAAMMMLAFALALASRRFRTAASSTACQQPIKKRVTQWIGLVLAGPPGLAAVISVTEGSILTPATIVTCFVAFFVGSALLIWSERKWPA